MKKWAARVRIIIISALLFWFFLHDLGKWPFRAWDESRLITSAYELTENHKFLTPTIEGGIDLWSCKPPLMIWAEALCIKLFGFCEWSVRLPAAICGILVTVLTAFFIRKITGGGWASLIPVVVLCTSGGLIGYHAARFAEYDAMLTLFTTCYLLCFFLYSESCGTLQDRYLLGFFIFLSLACLTKGIAGLLFTPALAIYLIFRKQLIATLLNKNLYYGLGIFILLVPGYYILREHFNPGYLQAVWDNELGGRYNTTLGGPIRPFSFYIQAIRRFQFSTWVWALWLSLFTMWFWGNHKIFRLMAFCWLTIGWFMLVISKSQTKLLWYDLPVFPLFAIIVSLVIYQMSLLAANIPLITKNAATIILIIIFSVQPLYESYNFLHYQYDDLNSDPFYSASYYFRDAIYGKRNLNGTIYLSGDYDIQWRLYVKWLIEKGVKIEDHPYLNGSKFNAGDKVIANQTDMQQFVEKNYNCVVTEQYYGVKNYLITSVK